MGELFRSIKKRVLRGSGSEKGLKHDWRQVREGPLAGVWLFLPQGEGAEWAERYLTGEYESEMVSAIGELAQQRGTLYDLGAHIGYYTCVWLKLGGERVEAFEPAPYNREILLATIEKNGFAGRVRVHEVALGDKEGDGVLLASKLDIGAASAAYLAEYGGAELPPGVQSGPLPGTESVKVGVRRLDDVVADGKLPAPNVVKLDIEGAEAGALAGAENMLEQHHPAIICELHSVEGTLFVTDRLARLGYVPQVLGKNGPHIACIWR